jgi:hypothetical protein
LLQLTAPAALNCPAGHKPVDGDDDVEPAAQAYPASQSTHTDAPPVLNFPAMHIATVPFVAPGTGHT